MTQIILGPRALTIHFLGWEARWDETLTPCNLLPPDAFSTDW